MNVPTQGSRLVIVVILTAVTLLHTSCLPDYFPRRQIKERVFEEQVTGRWHLTGKSVAMLNRHQINVQSGASTADLSADGRCLLHDFAYGDLLISGTGTWKVEHDVAEGGGSFKKNELQIDVTSDKKPGLCFFNFSREHKHLIFWQYYTDPDSREYIEYERD